MSGSSPRGPGRGATAGLALALVVAASSVRAQPSVTVPAPSAAELLLAAGAAADQGDWPQVIARATPVATDPRQRSADRAEAHRLLGLAALAEGRVDDADRELFAYLRLDLDGHLDPHLYPPETIAYFESVRGRHAAELRALRPRPARTVLRNFVPPLGQFQNRQRTKGWILAGLGGAALATNITSYLVLRRWCDTPDDTCEVDGQSRRATAGTLLDVNRLAGLAAIGVYVYGVIDGFRHYQRRPTLVVAPVATGQGAVLGLAGAF